MKYIKNITTLVTKFGCNIASIAKKKKIKLKNRRIIINNIEI